MEISWGFRTVGLQTPYIKITKNMMLALLNLLENL